MRARSMYLCAVAGASEIRTWISIRKRREADDKKLGLYARILLSGRDSCIAGVLEAIVFEVYTSLRHSFYMS